MIIIGAGGFAREVHVWARDAGITVDGFYQDADKAVLGTLPGRLFVSLGQLEGQRFIVAVGDPAARRSLWAKALGAGMLPSDPLIHPSSLIGNNVDVGRGSIICPMVVVTCDAKLGRGVILNLSSTVGHDSTLGDWTTVSPGANISGNCHLGMFSYVGTNAAIREGTRMGEGSVLGMGAVLLENIPNGETWVGNPAKKLPR